MSKEYDQYLKEHISNVRKAYEWMVANRIIKPISNYFLKLDDHDKSKYSDEEYFYYDHHFYGKGVDKDNDPQFDFAWLHHIHSNPHHWQHWVLHLDDGGYKALEIPYCIMIEMVCDWASFAIKKGDMMEVISWYDKNRDHMILHPATKANVECILDKILDVISNNASDPFDQLKIRERGINIDD